ncbi:MAG: hypothetical protein FWG00_05375 [Coriobacteriia bacterium]|nr:hypothetical protein [Coriobacteriia bacterium]
MKTSTKTSVKRSTKTSLKTSIKSCPNCKANLFADLDFCYECMQPTVVALGALPLLSSSSTTDERVICIKVAVEDDFSYEARLQREEGALLSVGSAQDNAIVIPQPQVSAHQLDIFFSQGYLWAEEKGATSLVQLDGVPLDGMRSLQPGACLELCGARLNLV